MTVNVLQANGTVKEKVVTLDPSKNNDLAELTELPEYEGFEVDVIEVSDQTLSFTNGVELSVGEDCGADKDAIFQAQIQETIERHIQKQKKLKKKGIKVLSLFFIDRVDNYREEDGVIRRLFNEAFLKLRDKYPDWKNLEPDEVQAAYFSQKSKKGGEVELLDTTGKGEKDAEAYELIMRDKETLLAFPSKGDDDETRRKKKVAFIFSHSALREGWDSPNVFQICTLNQTASDMKKRQEIGRGVRLCVNQDGDRQFDRQDNILTVVANESYEQYVGRLQSEIEQEYGKEGVPPPPPPANRVPVKVRKKFLLKPEFKELWDRIKHKTRYAVRIKTDELVKDVVAALDKETVSPPRVAMTRVDVKLDDDNEDAFRAAVKSGAKTVVDLAGRYPLPNLIDKMLHQLEHTTPPVRVTRKTLVRILRETKIRDSAAKNPQEFVRVAVGILKTKLADHLVRGIEYSKIDDLYEMSQFKDLEAWERYLVPAEKAKRSLYEGVIFDSGTEEAFALAMEDREDVLLYVKLPDWFKVTTPVGTYNPDWAIVMKDENADGKPLLYLVRETKPEQTDNLRRLEELKITCGEKHFEGALGVSYEVVNSADELPGKAGSI